MTVVTLHQHSMRKFYKRRYMKLISWMEVTLDMRIDCTF